MKTYTRRFRSAVRRDRRPGRASRSNTGSRRPGRGSISSKPTSCRSWISRSISPPDRAYDPADKVGLASLTRSLLDAGAGDLDEEKIAGRLVDIGARLSGSTECDRANVTLRTLSTEAERDAALELMRVVLQQPTLPGRVLEREKARTIAGIKEADTRPDSIAAKRFSAAIYPGHPYGFNATAETVGRIGRDDLGSFHRNYYSAARSTVAHRRRRDARRGRGDRAAAHRRPAGRRNRRQRCRRFSCRRAETVKVAHPATQSHIHVGLPGMRRGDPDYFPLLVGNYILGGGGFVSRLLKEVREKRGYAYSVYSYFQPHKELGPVRDRPADQARAVRGRAQGGRATCSATS